MQAFDVRREAVDDVAAEGAVATGSVATINDIPRLAPTGVKSCWNMLLPLCRVLVLMTPLLRHAVAADRLQVGAAHERQVPSQLFGKHCDGTRKPGLCRRRESVKICTADADSANAQMPATL